MGFWDWFGGTMDEGDEEPAEPEVEEELSGADEITDPDQKSGPDIVEIEHRVGELEEGLERNGGRIENVQHAQREVTERVEEMNETVRDLLGIYERLTSDVNPFTEEDGQAGRFGVVNGNGEHAGATAVHADAAGDRARETMGDDDVADEDSAVVFEDDAVDEDVFTFDDVVADLEREEPAEPTGEEPTGPGTAGRSNPGRRAGTGGPADRTPYLTALADGYATDVLALEWLAELVETTGPAATLKAVSYYEDVGWIGPSVAADLEEYLAGPGIDVHVDPNEPAELTVEDHVTSYEYILRLDAIRELEYTA